jgi:hypothetical protein
MDGLILSSSNMERGHWHSCLKHGRSVHLLRFSPHPRPTIDMVIRAGLCLWHLPSPVIAKALQVEGRP